MVVREAVMIQLAGTKDSPREALFLGFIKSATIF